MNGVQVAPLQRLSMMNQTSIWHNKPEELPWVTSLQWLASRTRTYKEKVAVAFLYGMFFGLKTLDGVCIHRPDLQIRDL